MTENPIADALEHLYDALDDDPDAPLVAVDPAALTTLLADHRRLRDRTESRTESRAESPAGDLR